MSTHALLPTLPSPLNRKDVMHTDHRLRPVHRAENPYPEPNHGADRLAAKVAWLNHRAKHRAVFAPNVKQARAEIDARTARLEDEGVSA